MSIRFLCNLLLVVCFLCNVSDFSYLYADPREQFSVIWRDPSKIDVASDCLRQCISDEKSLLNITKHLIGHGHILDISETRGKLSADFLFILSDHNIVSYLKFLRGIYNIRNDGTNGHPMGALFSLKFGTSVSSRLNVLKDMRNIFTYGLSCTFIKEQCEVVLSKISELSAILKMSEKLESASRSAFTFQRQLTKKQEGALRNLDKRIPRENVRIKFVHF